MPRNITEEAAREFESKKNDPSFRKITRDLLIEICDNNRILPPFRNDMEDMIDWVFTTHPTNNEISVKLQKFHNNRMKNLISTRENINIESGEEKKEFHNNEMRAIREWENSIEESERNTKEEENKKNLPARDPNSPFGSPFGP